MVSKKERFRKPTGHTLSEIVRLLQKKENQRLRFKDILEKIGVSKPVLSNHLKKLEKEKTIVSIKEGREKYYMLSKNIFKIPDRRMDILSSNYSEYVSDYLIIREYSDIQDLFDRFSQKISPVLFYTVLKSMETGQDWTKAIDIREFLVTALLLIPDFMTRENIPNKLSDPLSEATVEMDFKNIKKHLDKIFKNKTKRYLEPLYEALREKHPHAFEVIDYSYKKPQADWAKHYTEMNKRK